MTAASLFTCDGEVVCPSGHAASPVKPRHPGRRRARRSAGFADEPQGRPQLRPARATVEILGPIPMAPGRVRIAEVWRGRATEFFTAVLEVDEAEALRVALWRMMPAPPLPAGAETGSAPVPRPGPDELPDYVLPSALFSTEGYAAAMQWRMAAGGFDVPGPATAWSRPRHPCYPTR